MSILGRFLILIYYNQSKMGPPKPYSLIIKAYYPKAPSAHVLHLGDP